MKSEIGVSSITYAMKGKEILARYGIKANVKRQLNIEKRKGCGYSIVVDEKEEAVYILKRHGIKIREDVE